MLNTLVYISAGLLWATVGVLWFSVHLQRLVASFLIARSESLKEQRKVMKNSLKEWDEKLGVR